MHHRTVSRISSAHYDAQRMRLPGTAERLDILRREMKRFHEFRDEKLEMKRKWAFAKLEDIERTLAWEKEHITDVDMEHIENMQTISKCIKTVIYLGTTAMVIDMLNRITEGAVAEIAFVFATGASVAIMMSKLVDRFIGGTFEDAAKNIEIVVSECKEALRQGHLF
ncbi:MAG: hypothetical protein V1861_04870 [Candidatus Micrarchaeota archaeon]